MKAVKFLAVTLMLCAFTITAYAYPPDKYFYIDPNLGSGDQFLTGDWGTWRDKLYEENGIKFTSSYVCDVLGNPAGGIRRQAKYDHSMGFEITIDMEKFAGLEGLTFDISGLYRSGHNLSKESIGNDMVVSSIFGHEQWRFYAMYLEQQFFDNFLNVRIGRFGAADDFTKSNLYAAFVTNSIDGCPITVPINIPYSVYPTAAWGARARINLTNEVYTMSGIYNGDPDVERDEYHGMDFSMRLSRGILYMQEIAYAPYQNDFTKGYPGNYKVGFYYHSAIFRDFYSDAVGAPYVISGQPQEKHKGTWGVYIHIDQMIYKEENEEQGLWPFIGATLAPPNVNKFPYFLYGGMVYWGLIPGRDNDFAAIGFAYAMYSEDLRHTNQIQREQGIDVWVNPPKYEFIMDFTYRIQFSPYIYLQPDIQYVNRPGGTKNIRDAMVVGGRFGVLF